ncbi:DUF1566 domain-containing protein [Photobacterium iliopiscarium]|nr:DUF1566 domain-containing protein [Photobacterium iliopiscarium]
MVWPVPMVKYYLPEWLQNKDSDMKNSIGATLLSLLLISNSVIAAEQQCVIDAPKSAPSSRYIVNNNGTAKDIKTGLTWMRCTVGKHWDTELQTCSGDAFLAGWQVTLVNVKNINNSNSTHYLHNFAGIKHWRLPNIKELQSIQETSCYQPSVNASVFPSIANELGANEGTVWSSTPSMITNEAYIFGLYDGMIFKQGVNVGSYATLLVSD